MKMFNNAPDKHIVGRSTRKGQNALWSVAAFALSIALGVSIVGCPDDTTDTPGGGSTVVYTCENGTPVDGTPSGTSNVEECKACTTGFALSAEKKCVEDSTAPTFTVGPSLKSGSIGTTSVTVTLTASEVGTLFWALYTNGTTVADAAALINDATRDTAPTAVVARSATAIAVDTTTDAVEIALTGLTKSTSYTFYAVLQDAAQNTSDLSSKLDITTADTVKYTCTNGTQVDGTPSGTNNVEECKACNAGFVLTAEKKCVADTNSTNPTFTTAPALKSGSVTETDAEITLTASEAGKLFWVLYAENAPAPADAAALINDATRDTTPATVIIRSAPAGVDVTTTEETVMLSGLTAATTYNFYAVLQDAAQNTSDLSPKLDITTTASATPKPDFTVAVETTTPSVLINTNVSLSATVTNSGTAAADPTTLQWYSSLDATIDLRDTTLGDPVDVAALAAGASASALTTSVTAPATPGTIYYGACVTAIAAEATAANNCHSVAITVTATPQPDLTVADPTASSATVVRGATFTLSTTVANGGSAGAAATNLQWYSSADTTITTSDTPVGNAVTVAVINAGATSASLSSGDIGADSTPGMYHYGACVAAVNDEATTENNCSPSITITVPPIYTCSNGMPADGEPTGTADVAECKSCNSGFKLVGTTCVATEYTCSNGMPADGEPTGTADVAECKSCNSGFKLIGTTCVDTEYTCPANGTAKDGKPNTTADQVVCERCNDGFKLAAPSGGTIGDPNTTCVATKYTCPDGTAKTGSKPAGTSDVVACQSCSDGFKLMGAAGADDTTCVATQYTCTANGTPKTGSTNTTSDQVVCAQCNDGFKLAAPNNGAIGDPNTTCVDTQYTCSNGTPADGKPTGTADVAQCKSCKNGYALNSNTLCAYTDKDFNTLTAAGNTSPTGIWSNDTTMWVGDFSDDKIYAYTLATKARDAAKDFNTLKAAGNTESYGTWSDSTTVWLVDFNDDKIYAYTLATKARDAAKDFNTLKAAGNTDPAGIWSDDTTMWVVDSHDSKLYAYNLATKARDATKDFNTLKVAGNTDPAGIWSNGTTMWVADAVDDKLYAYNVATKARESAQDFNTLKVAGNTNPAGIWSDDTTMWVADFDEGKIYAYNLATKARDTRDTAQDFNTLTAAENTDPTGIWSNGTTVWVADTADTALYAYNVATKARDTAQDIALAADNTNPPYGIWSDGSTVWVADNAGNKLYAYNVATKARDSTQDIALAAGNTDPYGIWSNGTTVWVADTADTTLYAYTLATQDRESTKDITLVADNEDPLGIWSDGTTMWVSDAVDGKLYAYTLATKARDAAQDFNTLKAAGNTDPFGIWSDGATMWVVDTGDGKIYAYPVP